MRFPSLDLGTVVILSTIKRLAKCRPLFPLGSMSNRMSGASVSSVVKAPTVIEAVESKDSVLAERLGKVEHRLDVQEKSIRRIAKGLGYTAMGLADIVLGPRSNGAR